MWTGHEYFMEKQPKANKQKKEKLYILSTISEMCQEHRWEEGMNWEIEINIYTLWIPRIK